MQIEVAKLVPTADVVGSLAGKHFFVSDAQMRDYCVWFKVNGIGSDPTPQGCISVCCEIPVNASKFEVAQGIIQGLVFNLGLDPQIFWVSPVAPEEDPESLDITHVELGPMEEGATADIVDGDTGWSFEVLQQGE